jgi:hypothetical protein
MRGPLYPTSTELTNATLGGNRNAREREEDRDGQNDRLLRVGM